MKVLILSDKRAGHENQSIAFAKLLHAEFDILHVEFKNRFFKLLSYVFDFIHVYVNYLFTCRDIKNKYDFIVSTGSSTYYANKTLSRKNSSKSIVLMLPKGYRLDFDYIFAQSHDNPPKQKNIIDIPANFSLTLPKNIYKADKKSIGIIIGGNNSLFKMNKETIKKLLDFISQKFDDYDIAITTSPRTPKEIEILIESYDFEYKVIFSKNRVNPIGDFLALCEYVFITIDSTSMISEAISFGNSYVEIVPLDEKTDNKFYKLAESLQGEGYLHMFDGKISDSNKKIDFCKYAEKVSI